MLDKNISRKRFYAQLDAIGKDAFEIGIKDPSCGSMYRGQLSLKQIESRFKHLQHRNAQGDHIYVRPYLEPAVVLIDDLTVEAVRRLGEDGVNPACIVLTSPNNYQAWIKIAKRGIDPALMTIIGGYLATQYNGDQGSKDFRHLGRAAGFTNRKEEHRLDDGMYPYVLLMESSGAIAERAKELIRQAIVIQENQRQEQRKRKQAYVLKAGEGLDAVTILFQKGMEFMMKRHQDIDMSRAEAAVVVHLLKGGYSADHIRAVMESSASIMARKKGHVEDYVNRTVAWAEKAANVTVVDDKQSLRA